MPRNIKITVLLIPGKIIPIDIRNPQMNKYKGFIVKEYIIIYFSKYIKSIPSKKLDIRRIKFIKLKFFFKLHCLNNDGKQPKIKPPKMYLVIVLYFENM